MFSLFSRKRNILDTDLLANKTDIHCHLLPGVDDGVRTEAEAVASLKALNESGIARFVFTPHVMEEMPDNTACRLQQRFESFRALVPSGIEVRLAAEYMLDGCFRNHLESGLLSMGGGHVLVETSYLSASPDMRQLLYEVVLAGYTPVIAHPERYVYMEGGGYGKWKEAGCKFQLNLLSLGGYYGRYACEVSHKLLKRGMYDYAGTDFHNLKKHSRGMEHLQLTASEQKQVRGLLENNNVLW